MDTYRTPKEIIAFHKEKEAQELSQLESMIGDFCGALRGFIEISGEWKTAADEAFNINIENCRDDHFTARAVSLSLLTTKILTAARDVPRVLLSGAIAPALVTWRYVAESKNIAMLIDLDVDGTAGFLWLHHSTIEQAKVDPTLPESIAVARQARGFLEEVGSPYSSKVKEPWAIGIDGKTHSNSVDRSKYIWKYRKYPSDCSDELRCSLAEAEQKRIRASNALAHPTLTPRDIIEDIVHAMMLTTVIDVMAVMLAYKVAASDVVGLPYTKTVGEQFHIYPQGREEVRAISSMVQSLYEHCFAAFQKQFIGKE